MTVHYWLKYSVYLRVKELSNKNILKKIGPELITFMTSAIWHGFYPNYYVAFFLAYELEQVCSLLIRKTYFFETLNKWKNNIITFPLFYLITILSAICLNCVGAYFCLTTFEKGNLFVYNGNAMPILTIPVIHVLLLLFPKFKKDNNFEKIETPISNDINFKKN